MKVTRLNLTTAQGSDDRYAIRIKDESGSPINLLDETLRGKAKLDFCQDTADFVIDFTVRDQAVTGAASGNYIGWVDMLIAKENTTPLDICETTQFYYDVEWVRASGDVQRILEGVISMTPEVTK